MKRTLLPFLALALLLIGVTACDRGDDNGTEPTPPRQIVCTVSVTDPDGVPITDVFVNVSVGDVRKESKAVNAEGKAEFTLEQGSAYAVSLSYAEDRIYHYEETVTRVNDTSTEIAIVVYPIADDTVSLYAYTNASAEIMTEQSAFRASEGYACAKVVAGARTYFVFRPQRTGVYRITLVNSKGVTLATYGMPINPTKNPTSSGRELEVTVKEGNLGTDDSTSTRYLIGLETDREETVAILRIQWMAPPFVTPEDAPWIDIRREDPIPAYQLKRGILTDVDITDSTQIAVFSEKDGYYHLGAVDGPVLLLRIASDSPYMDDLVTICGTSRLGAYRYDEKGQFLRKENYNTLIDQYAPQCDAESGVYPLDKPLAEMLLAVGTDRGWWNADGYGYLFGELSEPVAEAQGWLFACCYLVR